MRDVLGWKLLMREGRAGMGGVGLGLVGDLVGRVGRGIGDGGGEGIWVNVVAEEEAVGGVEEDVRVWVGVSVEEEVGM